MSLTQGQNYTADGTSILLTTGSFSSIDPRPARITADVPSINGTQAITGFAFSAKANTNYAFFASFVVADGNATGLSFQIHALAAGAAVSGVWGVVIGAAGTGQQVGYVTAVTTNIVTCPSAAVSYIIQISGVVTVGANATTLQIDMVDTGVTNTIRKGGYMEVQVIV